MTYEEYTNKLINRFLLHGKKIVDYSCFPYGRTYAIVSGEKVMLMQMIFNILFLHYEFLEACTDHWQSILKEKVLA